MRNAFLAAAGVGLLVAVLLATRSRPARCCAGSARLRAAALRITAAGPDAPPMPHDDRRDEVGDLARALARMQEELRRQEAARRAFVSTASHELRTPLTMLQGTMELLEEDLAGAALDELGRAAPGGRRARRELRRLSRAGGRAARPLPPRRRGAAALGAGRAGRAVRAVAAEFELRARERDVESTSIPPDGAVLGPRRPGRGRARRAHPARQRAALRPARRAGARAGAARDGAEAAVTVADRGPGVPAEEREHIFERFHRGSAAGSEGGFGLGLAIGRELAVRMGGELRLVDAEPGARRALRADAAQRAPRRRERAARADRRRRATRA